MKKILNAGRLLTMLSLGAGMANAGVIWDFTSYLTNPADTTLTQTGRLIRSGIPQDWSGTVPFPGVNNTATVFDYQIYSINVTNTPFIQIDIDSTSVNTFVSAYLGSYLPNSASTGNRGFDTNWLGDDGSSGNLLPGDPSFFQVVVPVNGNLLIVVNQTAAGTAGLGSTDPFHITVEGFIDSAFTDAPATPEPASVILFGSAMFVLFLYGMKKRSV